MVPGPRIMVAALALIGIASLTPPLMFAVASVLCLFASYLLYAGGGLAVYYLEATPVLAAVAAHGIMKISSFLRYNRQVLSTLGLLLTGVLALDTAQRVAAAQRWHERSLRSEIDDWLARLPRTPAVVFIRYPCAECAYVNLVQNFVDLKGAPIWIVNDLGVRDSELTHLVPDRATYTLDADAFGLQMGKP